jgi:hypothetical protein
VKRLKETDAAFATLKHSFGLDEIEKELKMSKKQKKKLKKLKKAEKAKEKAEENAEKATEKVEEAREVALGEAVALESTKEKENQEKEELKKEKHERKEKKKEQTLLLKSFLRANQKQDKKILDELCGGDAWERTRKLVGTDELPILELIGGKFFHADKTWTATVCTPTAPKPCSVPRVWESDDVVLCMNGRRILIVLN